VIGNGTSTIITFTPELIPSETERPALCIISAMLCGTVTVTALHRSLKLEYDGFFGKASTAG
jgi:hypothetical protein